MQRLQTYVATVRMCVSKLYSQNTYLNTLEFLFVFNLHISTCVHKLLQRSTFSKKEPTNSNFCVRAYMQLQVY